MMFLMRVFYFILLLGIVGVSQSCQQQKNQYLVGYKASDVYLHYQKKGFQLDSGLRTFLRNSKKIREWALKKEVKTEEYTILVYGDAEEKLEKIVLAVNFKENAQKRTISTENKVFFEDFIQNHYKGSKPNELQTWLKNNLGVESRFKDENTDFYTTLDKHTNSLFLALHPL